MQNKESYDQIRNLGYYRNTNMGKAETKTQVASKKPSRQGLPKINYTSGNIIMNPIVSNKRLNSFEINNDQEEQEILIMQQVMWGKQQKQERIQHRKRSQIYRDLDTLTAIIIVVLLFALAFYLAPNQHYQPKN